MLKQVIKIQKYRLYSCFNYTLLNNPIRNKHGINKHNIYFL